MNRRNFLKGMAGILAAGVAPAFVSSVMRINPDIVRIDTARRHAGALYWHGENSDLFNDPKNWSTGSGNISINGQSLQWVEFGSETELVIPRGSDKILLPTNEVVEAKSLTVEGDHVLCFDGDITVDNCARPAPPN